MARDFRLTITDPTRAAEFLRVFRTATVYVRSSVPERANLPGRPKALIYLLDLDELTRAQRARLVAYLATRFGYAPWTAEVILEEEGLPILAEDTRLTVSHPQRWFP